MENRRAAYLLDCAGAVVLLVGLSSAVCIYQATERRAGGSSASESGDTPYELNPDYSKQYLRELEIYGGQAYVLAYEIRQWFRDLWQGKSLAYIVAGVAMTISFALFYAARRLPPRAHG